MTIVVHHLQRSQSERIVWLLEELGLPYELKNHRRDKQTLLAPAELKAIHPAGTAPVIQDGALTLSESSAIIEYILAKYAPDSGLAVKPTASNYVDYLFWFHWAIGSLQPTASRPLFIKWAGVDPANPMAQAVQTRLAAALAMLDARLAETGAWLAGSELTVADIYAVFSVSTMRLFAPFELTGYDHVVAWLARAAERPAYKRFVDKAEAGEDRGVFPVLAAEAPSPLMPGQ